MNTLLQRDPTRTAGVRSTYVAACRQRFLKVRKAIWETVVKNDALYLAEAGLKLNQAAQRYAFPSDPVGKSQAFMDWLQGTMDEDVLEVIQREGRKIVLRTEWQNLYVRSGYGRGLAQAEAAVRKAGVKVPEYSMAAVFNRPIHADTLAMLYVRNFNDLLGIDDALSAQISRALANGLAQGLGPRQVAQLMVKEVDGIGIRRATLMARTEIVRAHAEATLNRYEEFGVRGVRGRAEFSTSQDGKVCNECTKLQGKVFTLQEARGVLPVHPRCRCTWLPVV